MATILVIDDEQSIRRLLKEVLEKAGGMAYLKPEKAGRDWISINSSRSTWS